MCGWPKCGLATQLKFCFQNHFLYLIEYLIGTNYSKFNNSHTLGLKTSKLPSLNPMHKRFSNNIRSAHKFFFNFDFNENLVKNCSIFNNFSTIIKTYYETNLVHPCSLKAFKWYPRPLQGILWFRRSQCDKPKKTSYFPS